MKKLALFASVLMLGVLAASAGTLGVAQFNDSAVTCDPATLIPTTAGNATFLTLKNNTGAAAEYTVLYFSLLGVDRTPGANTFSIAGNAARGWRPVQTDASEGAGSDIPNATGSGAPGTASIIYTGAASDVSGRALTTAGVVQIAYAWTLVP
jgi:hypothetical protein